jgi:peptidoglycan/LPS O-acetylase OafA/YrhL
MSRFGFEGLGYHTTYMAGYGVTLFFVLSGYLITYLLLSEKSKFGKVEIFKFYKRRILRIWPIYYLMLLISALLVISGLLPASDNKAGLNFTLYVLLLANLANGDILTLGPLWSIGVEEQFYLFWPVLLNKSVNVFRSLLAIIIIYLAIKIGFRFFEHGPVYSFISYTTFDSMAIGGIMANFVFQKNAILNFFYNPILQVVVWVFLIVSVFYKPVHIFSLFDSEMHAICYSILIVNVSTNPLSIVNLQNRVMDFLGRISYGLYVYHMLVIWALSYFLKDKILTIHSTTYRYILIYAMVYGLTIFIAYLSFHYFESYFLRLKEKFAKINSTNDPGLQISGTDLLINKAIL